MHEFQTLKDLVNNILFVDIFKDISSDDCMQVRIHEIKDNINISIVFGSDYILQSNDILMTS